MPKKTILIVDKQKMFMELLIHALSSDTLTVAGSTSVDDARLRVELNLPELVVIDAAMADCIAFARSLHLKGTKVIGITSSEKSLAEMGMAGVETTVDRNSDLDTFVAAINQALHVKIAVGPKIDDAVHTLVVDDEEDIRNVLGEFLRPRGYIVSYASNGREALELIANDPGIRLVLLDVSMPKMGGMEALVQIMSANPHPIVIMITAVADREIALTALNKGAFDYILKPFEFNIVESSILAALSQSEYRKQSWWKRLEGYS